MSHRWEHEDEYLELKSAFRRAQKEGNDALREQLRPRIEELDGIKWRSKTARFPELAPYRTVVEALEQTAIRLELPFPDLAAPRNHTGDGQFIFGVSDGARTVQIWPMEDRGYYSIEVYEHGECYEGHTSVLEEATIVLNRWYMERCSIEALHAQLSWMSCEPFRLTGPRMTFG